MNNREKVLTALDCCENEDCDQCPYLEDECDIPFVGFVSLPVHLLSDIRAELREPDIPVQ